MIRYPTLVLLQNPILSLELWTRCPQLQLPALISHGWLIRAGFVKPSRVSRFVSVQKKELNRCGYPFELPMSLSWSTGYIYRNIRRYVAEGWGYAICNLSEVRILELQNSLIVRFRRV